LIFSLSDARIPLLTIKKVPWKTVVQELIWFFRGKPDVGWLEKRGVGIWSANSTREFLDAQGLYAYRPGDIGPMYPFTLRHFGYPYEGCDANYEGKGIDQLVEIENSIRKEPYSRRHVLTLFDPSAAKKSALWPCHGICVQFFVGGREKSGNEDSPSPSHSPVPCTLSCQVYCRSSDAFLGLPFNIASYAFLTHLIAYRCGLQASELRMCLGDTHLYESHVEATKELLSREPLFTPRVSMSEELLKKKYEEIEVDDFKVAGYMYHPSIKVPMAV
jgi:thymidylate synthase